MRRKRPRLLALAMLAHTTSRRSQLQRRACARAAARNPCTPRPERALVTRSNRQIIDAWRKGAHPRLERRAASARPGSRLFVSRAQRCASPSASLDSTPSHTPRALAGATNWRALRVGAVRRDCERERMRHESRVLRSNRLRDCPCARVSLSLPIYIYMCLYVCVCVSACACMCVRARARACVCMSARACVRVRAWLIRSGRDNMAAGGLRVLAPLSCAGILL